MVLEGIKKSYTFMMIGSGDLGVDARLGLCRSSDSGAPDSTPMVTITLSRAKSRGTTSYEISGLDSGGDKLFWARAKPTLRGDGLRVIKFRSSGSDDMSRYRDRSLAEAMLESFFAKRCVHDSDSAAGALAWHLSVANGEEARNLPEVWLRCNFGYQREATRIIDDIRDVLSYALAGPYRYTDEMLAGLTPPVPLPEEEIGSQSTRIGEAPLLVREGSDEHFEPVKILSDTPTLVTTPRVAVR